MMKGINSGMSIKIYNAYLFPGSHNELLKRLIGLKNDYRRFIKKQSEWMGVENIVSAEEIKKDELKAIDKVMKYLLKKVTGTTKVTDLFYCAILYFPVKYKRKTYNLICDFTKGQFNLTKLIPELKAFGYWNNTDPPEEVTEEEWALRRDIWNKVIGDRFYLCESGFLFEFEPEERLAWNLANYLVYKEIGDNTYKFYYREDTEEK